MGRKFDPERLEAVLLALEQYPEGAGIGDMVDAIRPMARERNIQRWLAHLVAQKKVVQIGDRRWTKYALPGSVGARLGAAHGARAGAITGAIGDPNGATVGAGAGVPAASDGALSPAADAVRKLVRFPISERLPCMYQRAWLDVYRPNETSYLSPELCRQLAAIVAAVGEGGIKIAAPTVDPAVELTWSLARLEGGYLSLRRVEFVLAHPERVRPGDRPAVAPVRAGKAAVDHLLAHWASLPLTIETLVELHAKLSDISPPSSAMSRLSSAIGPPPSGLPGLRTSALSFGAYAAPSDPLVIEVCFRQALGLAQAVTDPFEQAFFLLAQLLALQPFPARNTAVACLAVNLVLLRAHLPVATFAAVSADDLSDGALGLVELNRLDLLRDVFCRVVGGSVGIAPAVLLRPSPAVVAPPVAREPRKSASAVAKPSTAPTARAGAPASRPSGSPSTGAQSGPSPARPSGSRSAAPTSAVGRQRAASAPPPTAVPPQSAPPPAVAPSTGPAVDATIEQTLQDPDAKEWVKMIVDNGLNRRQAAQNLAIAAQNHPSPEWFTGTVQATLGCLDESNIARFGISRGAFLSWKQVWR